MKAILQQPLKSNSLNNALKPKEESRNKNEAITEPAVSNTAGSSFDFSNIAIYPPPAYVQTKLAVNSPGDEYEQEADAVAEKVMRMSSSDLPKIRGTSSTNIHRKCASCEKEKNEENNGSQQIAVQKKCNKCEEEENLQRKESGNTTPAVSNAVHQTLQSSGQELEKATRSFMETRFGFDFGKVKIHDDSTAHRSSKDIDAHAYTHGNHIVFAAGKYQPNTDSGRRLIAHELVHTVQQTGTAGTTIQRRHAQPKKVDIPKPQIVKIVAFEGDQKRGVAYVAYPARPELGQEATTVAEAVTLTENNLGPGKYKLHRGEQSPERYEGLPTAAPGKDKPGFRWLNPYVDKDVKELKYDWSESVEITILPYNIRNFLEQDRGPKATSSDLTSEIRAAEILVTSGITEEDLRREEHRAHDYFLKTTEVDPVLWAQSLAAQKVQGEQVALANRKTFLSAAQRLSVIRREDVLLVVQFMTDPDQANKATAILEIQRGDLTPVYPYLPGTDFRDRKDLWETATTFSNTLDFELRALAQAVLNATESAILLADAKFTGIFGTTKSYGNLSGELEKLNQDPEIKKLTGQIAFEKAHPPIIDPRTDLDDEGDPSTVHKFVRAAFPLQALAADQDEADKVHNEKIDALKKKLNDAVNAKSSLSVAGLKGFDASDFLQMPAEKVRTQLAFALADGSRRIDSARRKLDDDSKFIYGADKIIALEKAQLHVTPGSSLDQIIDGVVTARLEEKTLWESIVEIINILAMLPIPPPAGPILRAVSAGINLGESFNKAAAAELGHDTSLRSEGASGAGLALDIVITAAGTVADLASIESHAAGIAGHELNATEREAAQEITAGGKARGERPNLAGEEKEVEGAGQSLHLPSNAETRVAELTTEAEAERFVQEHPPTEVYGEPGERFAPLNEGEHSMVEEIDEAGHISCKLYSGKGIPVKCKEPLGGTVPPERIPLAGSENEAQRAADLRKLANSRAPLPKKLSQAQAAWQKDYEAYYAKRIQDLARGVEKEAPLTFDSYVKFQKSLRRARQGTGFQAEEADEIINRLGQEKVETNVGLSKEKNPKIVGKKGPTTRESQTKYVDALVRDEEHGYVGISNKAREFNNPDTIYEEVTADVKEMINKYGGDRYVRRRAMKEFGSQIEVNNLILSYEADRILTVAGQGATPLGMQQYIREVVAEVAQDYPDLNIAVVFR